MHAAEYPSRERCARCLRPRRPASGGRSADQVGHLKNKGKVQRVPLCLPRCLRKGASAYLGGGLQGLAESKGAGKSSAKRLLRYSRRGDFRERSGMGFTRVLKATWNKALKKKNKKIKTFGSAFMTRNVLLRDIIMRQPMGSVVFTRFIDSFIRLLPPWRPITFPPRLGPHETIC